MRFGPVASAVMKGRLISIWVVGPCGGPVAAVVGLAGAAMGPAFAPLTYTNLLVCNVGMGHVNLWEMCKMGEGGKMSSLKLVDVGWLPYVAIKWGRDMAVFEVTEVGRRSCREGCRVGMCVGQAI